MIISKREKVGKNMRKVNYEVKTPQLENFETSSFALAQDIKNEKGGKITLTLTPIAENPPKISEKKLEWLKSGAKPLHPYKGGVMVCRQ